MPQRTLAASSRVGKTSPVERCYADTPPPSTGKKTGQISTKDTSRRRRDCVRRALDYQLKARRRWTRFCSDGEIFWTTAGSCSVAINRSQLPQSGHARTSMENARCIRAGQVQPRGGLFSPRRADLRRAVPRRP